MANTPRPGARPLTEPERRAFQRLALSPGDWAALVAAPFLSRHGVGGPHLRTKNGFAQLHGLRPHLGSGTASGVDAERFWTGLCDGPAAAEIELAHRLLAWHLATDLTYAAREAFYERLWEAFGSFAGRPLPPLHDRARAVLELFRAVDRYLPVATFADDPAPVDVSAPAAAVLDAAAAGVAAAPLVWPPLDRASVRSRLPVTVRAFGAAVRDWWGRPDAPRFAAARGTAGLPFDERERLYEELESEWTPVFQATHRTGQPRDGAARFVRALREWVDGVRFAARVSTGPPEPPPPVSAPARAKPPARAVVPTVPTKVWRCSACGIDTPMAERWCSACRAPNLPKVVELRSVSTGKGLRVRDGGQIGRSEYREVFGEVDAGLAAADQFRLVRDVARGAWLVVPVGAPSRRTYCDGLEVPAEGRELSEGAVISVGAELPLAVRFL